MQKMNFREELGKICPKAKNGANIYIFGTGQQWEGIRKLYIDVVNVDLLDYVFAFIDNDLSKCGQTISGKPVLSPNEIDFGNAVVLISTALYGKEIALQLQEYDIIRESDYFQSGQFYWILKKFVYSETLKFKNTVRGGRCFIIGNGPSLKVADLDVLQKTNEISFASNKIYHFFDKTKWRPSYYFLQDPLALDEVDIFKQMETIKFFASYLAKQELFNENTYYFDVEDKAWFYEYPYKTDFSTECAYVCVGGSITYSMIQIAVGMGYDELYLLGIDFSYPVMVLHDGTVVKKEVDGHFYYDGKPFSAHYDRMLAGFQRAKDYAAENGIKIYNATRGGKLEIFERVDFESLFLRKGDL